MAGQAPFPCLLLATEADEARALVKRLLPSHTTLIIGENEGGTEEYREFQVLGLQMDLHNFHGQWEDETRRKEGLGAAEAANQVGELEVERIQEKDVVYVRRSDDGSC